jgi:hypothetical protein
VVLANGKYSEVPWQLVFRWGDCAIVR